MHKTFDSKLILATVISIVIFSSLFLSCSNANISKIDIEATVQARINEEQDKQEILAAQRIEIEKSVQATIQALNKERKSLVLNPSATPYPTTTPLPVTTPSPVPISVLTPTVTPRPIPILIPTVTPTYVPLATITPTPTANVIAKPMSTSTPNPSKSSLGVAIPEEIFSVSDVVAFASQAVVRIEIDLGDGRVRFGSGFIVREDGLVVTNMHVVDTNSVATVTLSDGVQKLGHVLVTDQKADLALIKIDAENLTALEFGDSNELLLGQEIIVIGYPKGLIGSATITKGLVSAFRENLFGLNSVIQTDAALNPGNSGGPMLDLSGKVIGVAQAKITNSEGLNLGIPSDEVEPVVTTWMRSYDDGVFLVPDLELDAIQNLVPDNVQGFISGDIYTNDKYWYSVEIPEGWIINYSNPDFVHLVPENSNNSGYESSGLLISSRTIDATKYPTIEAYARDWTVGPGTNVSSFNIDSHLLLPHLYPLQVDQYLLSYYLGNNLLKKRRDIRYLLGRHVITVTAFAPSYKWTTSSEVFSAMIKSQDSFDPLSFTSIEYKYSVSHPSNWKSSPFQELGGYKVVDMESSLDLRVLVYDNEGQIFISEYAESKGVAFGNDTSNGKILSKHIAYSTRKNPSYRIDFQYEHNDALIKGAALVTLTESKAIWVFVKSLYAEWDVLSTVIDQLLIRFAVNN